MTTTNNLQNRQNRETKNEHEKRNKQDSYRPPTISTRSHIEGGFHMDRYILEPDERRLSAYLTMDGLATHSPMHAALVGAQTLKQVRMRRTNDCFKALGYTRSRTDPLNFLRELCINP